MSSIRTSGRALLLALIPPAFLQGVLLALSTWLWEHKPFLGLPGPDGLLVLLATQMALNGGMLLAGHLILRHFCIISRVAYSVMGGLAAAVAYAMAARYGILTTSPTAGTWISAGVLPTLAGVLSGFLYGQFAGIERNGPVESGDFAGNFEGPVRVRTSLGAIALTAVVPAALIAVLSFTITQIGLGGGGAPKALYAALSAQVFMTTMLATVVPSGIFVLIVHSIARALGVANGLGYATVGAITGGLAGVVLFPFSPFLSILFPALPAVAFGAIMGALYRRFAGLEPLPLPEPILVTDEENLVPADDPARRGHSILLNG